MEVAVDLSSDRLLMMMMMMNCQPPIKRDLCHFKNATVLITVQTFKNEVCSRHL